MALRSERSECGSATIEATISLVIFIFVIFGIYMLANFCIVQAKVSYAIDATAKEMSQASYFYHVLGLSDVKSDLGDKASQAVSAYENLSKLINTTATEAGEISSDADAYISDVLSGEKNDELGDLANEGKAVIGSISEAIENPVDFMKSVAALAGKKLWEYAAVPIARGMAKRHFGDDADTYLTNMGVVDGYDGLNFGASSLFTDGKKIEIVVYYRMNLKNIIPNPALNQEVVICQKAVTDGWLGGDAP